MTPIYHLYVEGVDDVGVINALLKCHGIDTLSGKQYLQIHHLDSVHTLLENMPDIIRLSIEHPVGFVLDIDLKCADRWNAVCENLKKIGLTPPPKCPESGYLGKVLDYQSQFGVWLMPDCSSDYSKLEDLCRSLLPENDPLWPHATQCVGDSITLIDEANTKLAPADQWVRFRDTDRVKAEIHTWLAWRYDPGVPMGTAVNAKFLKHDSPQALVFLKWLRSLYGFDQLSGL